MTLPSLSHYYRFNRKIALLTLLVISTGFDQFEVTVAAGNIRLSYLVYFLLFLIFRKRFQFRASQTLFLAIFVLLAIFGIFSVDSILRSALYLVWVVFSYLVIFGLFAYLAREYPDEMERSILYAFRLQILIGFVLFLLHQQEDLEGISRIHLLYYEPSYFAFALVIYTGIVFYRALTQGWRPMAFDLAMLLIALVITKSATLMMGFVIVYALGNLMTDFQWKKVAWGVGIFVALLGASYAYATIETDLIARTLRIFFSSGDVFFALIDRGGNRVPRIEAANYIFQQHPWLGVGIGNYESYTTHVDLSAFSRGAGDLDVQNKPAVNIYLELLVTTGIPTAMAFFAFLIRTLTLRRVGKMDDRQKSYLLGLIGLLLLLNFDGNYLRPYLWMILGLFSGSIPMRHIIASEQTMPEGQEAHLLA